MNHCDKCRNMGIVRIQNEDQGLDSLVYCSCEWAKVPTQVWKLPRVNQKIQQAFVVTQCPLEWFLPDNEKDSVPRGWLIPSMDDKIQEWMARLQTAVKFWDDWGNIFEERPKHWQDR